MARTFAKPIGALWRHKNERVGEFFSGILDLGGLGEIPVAVFKNDRKEKGKKHPDYRIVLSQRNGTGETRGGGGNPPSAAEQLPY